MKWHDYPFTYFPAKERGHLVLDEKVYSRKFDYKASLSTRAINRYMIRNLPAFEYFESLVATKDLYDVCVELSQRSWPHSPFGRFRGNKFAYFFMLYMCQKHRSLLDSGPKYGYRRDEEGGKADP